LNLDLPYGIGTDLVDITRFKKKPFQSHQNFYKKIFTNSEIEYCTKFKSCYEHFAGKFAIKEAVIKAISEKISFIEIHTSHSKKKPKIKLSNKLNKKYKFLVSVSHETNFAIAVVISTKTT